MQLRIRLRLLKHTFLALTMLSMSGLIAAPAAMAAGADPNTLAPTVTTLYCGNGIYVHTAIPHQGFNPLTATDAQLQRNHLPPRPGDAAGLHAWTQSITRKHAAGTCPIGIGHPGSPERQAHVTSHSAPLTMPAAQDSANWTGYQAYESSVDDSSGGQGDVALGNFTVPVGGTGNGPGGVYLSSSWVGVGQGNSATYPLVQGGTESDFTSGVGFEYYLWWEVFPQLAQQKISVVVNPGDVIHVEASVDYQSGLSAPSEADVEVADITNGVGVGTWYDYTTGTFYPDGYMEWILERTEQGGSYPMLSDAPTSFSLIYGFTNAVGPYSLGEMNATPIYMWNCQTAPDTELGDAGLYTDYYPPNNTLPESEFTAYWDNYGNETPVSSCGGAW